MTPLDRSIAHWVGIARSVLTYHGDPAKAAAMDALYGRFVKAGDLAFDIGAHVGDRVASFRRLGARAVALEPQPGPAAMIREIFRGDDGVTLVEAACGASDGEVTLAVNSANPTVTTASADFVAAADGAEGWHGQVWDTRLTVPCLTLDRLIADHGMPAFVKIDVEGFEADVLAGLSAPVAALSFEFTTIQRPVALACLDRLADRYRFDIALGESQQLTFGRWIDAQAMAAHLADLPHAANSGDIYAVLSQEP